MSNPHDPNAIYAKLHDLYAEAQRAHQASGDALVEIINALSRKAAADAAFINAFHHLVPQPMAQEPPPVQHRGQPMPGPVPPPDYADGYDDEAQDRAFVDRVNARRSGGGYW